MVRLGANDPVRVFKESPARSIVRLSGYKSLADEHSVWHVAGLEDGTQSVTGWAPKA